MNSQPVPAGADFEAATYRKVMWRLMPFLFLCYVLAYVDRVNVGFAKLQMQQDLRMSDSVYGLGAGIFFIGYFFFEVPSNMIMQRIGARFWIGPIMIVWGVVSACTMLVTSATGFYAVRFLLGIVESGFFPGVILYLTFWFTSKHRARMVAAFMSAIPVSGIIAGPISGWILARMNGVGHLSAWQWLFLMEGIPSLIGGAITLYYLTDNPAAARWLDGREKRGAGPGRHRFVDAFRSPQVWLLCLVYFGVTAGNYGIGFWLPQVIKETITKSPLAIGWLSIIPYTGAAIAMPIMGHHSDIKGERRWHFALCGALGAAAFAASSVHGIPGGVGLAALTLATMGILCSNALFWSLPTALLSGSAAAAGIAWINSVGNLAGYVSPFLVGTIRDRTHSMTLALLALSAAALGSALTSLYVTRKSARHPA
jgi:MFS family permease